MLVKLLIWLTMVSFFKNSLIEAFRHLLLVSCCLGTVHRRCVCGENLHILMPLMSLMVYVRVVFFLLYFLPFIWMDC